MCKEHDLLYDISPFLKYSELLVEDIVLIMLSYQDGDWLSNNDAYEEFL